MPRVTGPLRASCCGKRSSSGLRTARGNGLKAIRPSAISETRPIQRAGRAKRVKASSADISSMQAIAEEMQKDLYALSNDEFVAKYKLGSCS